VSEKEPSYLIRMSAARWQALADIARQIVPDGERPMTATKGSEWQRNAMFRAIADGRATVEWKPETDKGE
jgi:hypothetical protein